MNDTTTDTPLMPALTSQGDQPIPQILHATIILLLGIALLLPHILLSFQHLSLLLTLYRNLSHILRLLNLQNGNM